MFYHSLNIGFIEIPHISASLNIYTVGCPFKCKGCHNPDLQNINHPDRKILKSEIIETYINNSKGLIDGLCWLGGEPLFQFKDFISINHSLRYTFKNLSIALYTGYAISDIKKNHQNEYTDLINLKLNYIIDGTWNGLPISDPNTNQKIYKFDHNIEDYIQISFKEFKNGK